MTTATAIILSLLGVAIGAAVQRSGTPVIACNLRAIAAADRTRYHELVKRVRAAMRDRTELADGYAYRLDRTAVTSQEVEEWITLERMCCPFLTLEFCAAEALLKITGPEGVKPLLDAEFSVR